MMAQLVPVHEQVRGLRSAPIASEPAGVGGGSGLGRHR
jgi:hypothetical protein